MAEDGEGGGRGPRGPRSPRGARSLPRRTNAAPAPAQLRRGDRRGADPSGSSCSPNQNQAPPPRTRRGHQRRTAPPPAQKHTNARAQRGWISRARGTNANRRSRAQGAEISGRQRAKPEARRSAQARAAPADGPQPGTPMVRGDGWLDGCRRAAARLTPANQRAAARNPREGNSDTRAGANKRNWPRAQRRKCAVRPQGGCRREPPFPPLNLPLGAERQRGRGGEGGREAQAGGEGAGARKRRQQGGTYQNCGRFITDRSEPPIFFVDKSVLQALLYPQEG